MLAALLVTSMLAQTQPPPPSTQCLHEVAAINREHFNSNNSVLVDLFTDKFVKIWTSATVARDSEAEAVGRGRELLRKLRDDESNGVAPPGSYAAARSMMLRDMEAASRNGLTLLHRLAPACPWPAPSAPIAERLG